MKQRKIIAVILLLCLLLGIGGCARKQEIIYLSEEEFLSLCATVELTTENWEEFFEIRTGMEQVTEWDEEPWVYQWSYLVPKQFCVVAGEQVKFSLQGTLEKTATTMVPNTEEIINQEESEEEFTAKGFVGDDCFSGQLYQYMFAQYGSAAYEPADSEEWISCSRITLAEHRNVSCNEIYGTMMYFIIPETVWNTDEDGVRYLCVGKEDDFFRIYEPAFYDDTRRYFKKAGILGGGV